MKNREFFFFNRRFLGGIKRGGLRFAPRFSFSFVLPFCFRVYQRKSSDFAHVSGSFSFDTRKTVTQEKAVTKGKAIIQGCHTKKGLPHKKKVVMQEKGTHGRRKGLPCWKESYKKAFNKKKAVARERQPLTVLFSVVAAAAEHDHDRKNDDPSAVIVEEMAKAVVHMFPPGVFRAGFAPAHYHSMRGRKFGDRSPTLKRKFYFSAL